MAQITYKGTWSSEGLSVPKTRAISPRARSRSVHSPNRTQPRMRFASGQQQSPVKQQFLETRGWEDDWTPEWSEYEPEDSIYLQESPSIVRRRNRSPERAVHHHSQQPEMTWLRTAIYSVILFIALALVIKFILTLGTDLEIKYAHARADLVAEIAACRNSYNSNYCKENPPPALAQVCQEWAKCMELDPDNAGQVSITGAALGEIIEAFVSRLDLRSMLVLGVLGSVLAYWK